MRFILFATAGHVDHGKTTLIKALTGINTDRLPEEKRRGLSIDLGFAYLDFPQDQLRVELIDVPGHERFIKNAIAGLACAKGMLLVVDASEGLMPQTAEHVDVAIAFGIKGGVAVLTKIDKVDRELLELARQELKEFLEEKKLPMEVVAVSSLTGEGLQELVSVIGRVAGNLLERDEDKPLKIFVDSAFKVKGYGTVVRGSCLEGKVEEGSRVVVEPAGKSVRVRKIQNHGIFVRRAQAGERVALNIPDIEPREVERGFWILEPGTYEKGSHLILDTSAPVRKGKLHRLFVGMKEVAGRLVEVEENLYLVKLEEEVVTRRDDRVVLLSPEGKFLGGAKVMHPKPRILKKKFIRKNRKLLREHFELYLLKESGLEGLTGKRFFNLTGKNLNQSLIEKEAVKIGNAFYDREVVDKLREKLTALVADNPIGLNKAEALSRLSIKEDILMHLISSERNLSLVGEFIVNSTEVSLEDNPLLKKLTALLGSGIREEKELLLEGVPKEAIALAIKRKIVHRLGDYLLISDTLLRDYIQELRSLGESFSLQQAKKKLGLTRKYLIPLLEYLDFIGLTQRVGNERRWRKTF